MRSAWQALAELDRFAEFLQETYPNRAPPVGEAIIAKSAILPDHPLLGRPFPGRPEYRQVVLKVLKAAYSFQDRVEGDRIVMLRVFHALELKR